MCDPSTYKDFHIQKFKVLHLLCFLKEHNPYYFHIIIGPAEDIDLLDDGDILNCLLHVMSATAESNPFIPRPSGFVNDSVNAIADDGEITFASDELA